MPKLLQVSKFKLRYKDGKVITEEKEKDESNIRKLNLNTWREIAREYMGYRELLARVSELEGLLKTPEIGTALSFVRLHYISNSRPEQAKQFEDLRVLINKTVG